MSLGSDIIEAERTLWKLKQERIRIAKRKCEHDWETVSHLQDSCTHQHCYKCGGHRIGDYLKDPEFDEDWNYS